MKGVTLAVQLFMVKGSPLADSLKALYRLQKPVGVKGMAAYYIKFIVVQTTGLIKYISAYRQLAEVVEIAGHKHHFTFIFGKTGKACKLFRSFCYSG
jgi:hypothetical protein